MPILLNSIKNPWIVANGDSMFLIGSTEDKTVEDHSLTSGTTDEKDDSTVGSHYLCEYSRGGAVDRSVQYAEEDTRRISGKYYEATDDKGNPDWSLLVDKWQKIPNGYRVGSAANADVANEQTYFLPIHLRIRDVLYAPFKLEMSLFFDNTHWEPLSRDNSAFIAYDLPPERLASDDVALVAVCRLAGVGSRLGNEIYIDYDAQDALGVGAVWSHQPFNWMPVIYIPMRRKTTIADDCMSMGLEFGAVTITTADGDGREYYGPPGKFIYWQQATMATLRKDDPVGQPVDWCFKAPQIMSSGGNQVRLRGVFVRRLTHGVAPLPTPRDSNVAGQFNMLVASDWKDMSGQLMDFDGNIKAVTYKDEPRYRMEGGTPAAIARRIFNGVATWGDNSDPRVGNYLIDNEQYDSVSLSTSVRGEHVGVMLYGHIRDKAEDLRINEVTASLREGGGRRRTGR